MKDLSQLRTVVLDEADLLLTGAVAEPITAHLIPNVRHRYADTMVQFVFCAATMPAGGKKSVRAFIKRYFPDVVEVESDGAHKPPPTLQQVRYRAQSLRGLGI